MGFPLGGPGGRPRSSLISLLVLLVLIVCAAPLYFFFGGGDGGEQPAVQEEPALEQQAVEAPAAKQKPTARPTRTSPPPQAAASLAGEKAAWLVMLYQDADDKVLEQDIYVDLNEAERVGSSPQVHIVAQVDRYRSGFSGDGNWTEARRYYITQDDDLSAVGSQVVGELGEVNMADGATLVDFVAWAVQNYPAERYALVLSDHGMGWPGGWSDPTASGGGRSEAPIVQNLADHLYLDELDRALDEIRSQTGIDQFELIGMDACLMAHVEVFSALRPHARYAVASQETEPSLGWAYTGFLEDLQADPQMDGAGLGQAIVDSYITEDQRLVDDQARAEFMAQSSGVGGLFGAPPAEQITQQIARDITLTAVDLDRLPDLMTSLDRLALLLQQLDQRQVAKARDYARAFTSIFGRNVQPSYIDLGHFARLLAKESGSQALSAAADRLAIAINDTVVAEKHGRNKSGASGLSVYFPNSQLYSSPVSGPLSYITVASRFAADSLWDDFLAFHYTGEEFAAGQPPAAPAPSSRVRAPGAGDITVSEISLSSDSAAPGQPVLLSADVDGENIGHIKFFAGYFDREGRSIYIADMDFLESADTRQLDGVYYPDWGQGAFTLEFEWEPIVFAISDGSQRAVALFSPQDYGATAEQAVYTVDGTYTYADGEQRSARLVFRDGVLRQVFSYSGEGGAGAPREIIPQPGDTFTILENWLDLDGRGSVVQAATQDGVTLTFGEQPFTWVELDAAAGQYVVGYIVEDLDGNSTEAYTTVEVR
jgi:hypothetical protein